MYIYIGDVSGSVQEMSSSSNSLVISGKMVLVPGNQDVDVLSTHATDAEANHGKHST